MPKFSLSFIDSSIVNIGEYTEGLSIVLSIKLEGKTNVLNDLSTMYLEVYRKDKSNIIQRDDIEVLDKFNQEIKIKLRESLVTSIGPAKGKVVIVKKNGEILTSSAFAYSIAQKQSEKSKSKMSATERETTVSQKWIDGTGVPANNLGRSGDFYFQIDNGDIFKKILFMWERIGNIKGENGLDGAPGPQGPKGADGTISFSDLTQEQVESLKGERGEAGPKGDTGEIGPQGEQGVPGLNGLNGLDGSEWLDGIGEPLKDVGVDKDYYIDIVTADIYRKTKSNWERIGSIAPNLDRYATNVDLFTHVEDDVIHVTQANKDNWNNKSDESHTHSTLALDLGVVVNPILNNPDNPLNQVQEPGLYSFKTTENMTVVTMQVSEVENAAYVMQIIDYSINTNATIYTRYYTKSTSSWSNWTPRYWGTALYSVALNTKLNQLPDNTTLQDILNGKSDNHGHPYAPAYDKGNTSYDGIVLQNGETTGWIRTPSSGMLPSKSGNSADASSLGTASWNFSKIYGGEIFESNLSLKDKYVGKFGFLPDGSSAATLETFAPNGFCQLHADWTYTGFPSSLKEQWGQVQVQGATAILIILNINEVWFCGNVRMPTPVWKQYAMTDNIASSLQLAKDYADNKVAEIVDSSPETLNTLKELATALGDDPNFATTVATQLGEKADIAYVAAELAKKSNSTHLHDERYANIVHDHNGVYAPANFGLGGVCSLITDWSATTKTGWFMSAPSATSNAPNGENWFMGQSISHNDVWVYQEAINFTGDGKAYKRFCRDGSWEDWTEIGSGGGGDASNADTLDGKHADDFSLSTHNHDSVYLKISDSVAGVVAGSTSVGSVLYNGTTNRTGSFYGGVSAPTGTTRLNYDGYLYATRTYNAVYNDYAEFFEKDDIGETIPVGSVIVRGDNGYTTSKEANSRLVVGVNTEDTYGQCLGGTGDLEYDNANFIPVGVAGRANVRTIGIVRKGDYLVSSDIEGVAMASSDYIPGTVIGKALEDKTDEQESRISVLIMNI